MYHCFKHFVKFDLINFQNFSNFQKTYVIKKSEVDSEYQYYYLFEVVYFIQKMNADDFYYLVLID